MLIPLFSMGQHCNHFHERFCSKSDNSYFKYNGQSKSALFAPGQTSELNVIVYKGQDYRISLCMDNNLGEQVIFKIYESVQVAGKKEKNLLYDNAANDFSPEVEFSVETSKKLAIEISIPEGEKEGSARGVKKGKDRSTKPKEMGCVGVLLEHMSTPKTGF